MDKYAQLKRFHHDLQLKVYMYAFMYVDPETVPGEGNFLIQKCLLITIIKCKHQDRSQNIGLGSVTYVHKIMSYIRTLMKHN